jgi:hypothetical protein
MLVLDLLSVTEGVNVSGDRAGFHALAVLVAGGGELALPDEGQLLGVLVEATEGPVVAGLHDRRLTVRGGDEGRSILADELRAVGDMDDGGHAHIEYFEGHFYLGAGSLPLILISPHGGMPRR